MIDHPTQVSINPSEADEICQATTRLRAAQRAWAARPYHDRLSVIRQLPGLLAKDGMGLAARVVRPAASTAEILASEVLPLAETCRYTAGRGQAILRPRRLGQRDRAWWMGSVQVIELREALGLVLIIGPSNYPLYLPGVQLIQALAAGNAALIKPAPDCQQAMQILVELCIQAGVPSELMHVLPTGPEQAQQAILSGVDKVFFTGSLSTGRLVAQVCSQMMTPAAMELSGNDAVFVADDADLDRTARCVAYALALNGGQTCIAPRRLFATQTLLTRLIPLLGKELEQVPERTIAPRGARFAKELVERALADGAEFASGRLDHLAQAERVRPVVLAGVTSDMRVTQEDIFAPVLSLINVRDLPDALEQASRCSYALGASLFAQSPDNLAWAGRIAAGCITINDCLVPTADPRVSFGGRGASGFGLTRGLEGLREMTQLKVVCVRRGRWLPHLSTSSTQLAPMLEGILKLRHGGSWKERWAGIKSLMKVGKQK